MTRLDLRSWQPTTAVRAILLAEVAVYLAAFAAFAQFAMPTRDHPAWWTACFAVFAMAFPIAMCLLHGDRPADSGVRVDNFAACMRIAVPTGLLMAAGVALGGLAVGGWHWVSWRALGDKALLYLVWGPIQQYLLQAFAIRRLRQARLGDWPAIVIGAVLFGLCHQPNWTLVAVTAGAGIVWGYIFLRQPNILALGLVHGVLAILLYHAWPEAWTQRMTIGGEYIQRLEIWRAMGG